MLAAPYLLFAGICGLMYMAIRKARLQREAAKRPDENAAVPPTEPAANDSP
jgi:hypothetical protein